MSLLEALSVIASALLVWVLLDRFACRRNRRKIDKMAANGRVPLIEYCKCNNSQKCADCPYSAFNAIESCLCNVDKVD